MTVNNNAKLIRREILRRLAEILIKGEKFIETDRIPFKMRPKNGNHVRCCIHRDRAVIKYKILAILGFDANNEEDELKSLSSYFQESLVIQSNDTELLSVVDEACSSCQKNNYIVTNMCHGCVGRPCQVNCPKDAIIFDGDCAKIDHDKCVSCGLCQKVCPFHAIIYSPVPCEDVCPVNAISKDIFGKEKIDMEKCILCGKCMDTCPFGAIIEKTHLFDVIKSIENKQEVIAMLAPSIAGQFREDMGKISGSFIKLGFSDVYEVAWGADRTTQSEAAEFIEKAKQGQSMTSSCCPAYVNLIEKHSPELKSYVSTTPSPMEYTARMLREKHPNAKLVFVGPCIGKKGEAMASENVDLVLNFEEYGAWLIASEIEISECKEYKIRENISGNARNYAWSGGVSNAISSEMPDMHIQNVQFDGIDKHFLRKLKASLKTKEPTLVEVMSCEGGCVGGCSTITTSKAGKRQIEKFVEKEEEKSELIYTNN